MKADAKYMEAGACPVTFTLIDREERGEYRT
jgi:hypothetical protein